MHRFGNSYEGDNFDHQVALKPLNSLTLSPPPSLGNLLDSSRFGSQSASIPNSGSPLHNLGQPEKLVLLPECVP